MPEATTKQIGAVGVLTGNRVWHPLNLKVSPETFQRLEELAEQQKTSVPDILRRAFALYDLLFQAHQEGKPVGIGRVGQELDSEITGF